jgi:hypothetical protein
MFGADKLADELRGSGKEVERVSCLGQCDLAPASLDESMELVTYAKHKTSITPDDPELPMNLAGPVDLSYSALAKAKQMGPKAVIEQLKASGLQGRGGAGFQRTSNGPPFASKPRLSATWFATPTKPNPARSKIVS